MAACTCNAGTLPPSFSNLTQLSQVTLADNLLTGKYDTSALPATMKVLMSKA